MSSPNRNQISITSEVVQPTNPPSHHPHVINQPPSHQPTNQPPLFPPHAFVQPPAPNHPLPFPPHAYVQPPSYWYHPPGLSYPQSQPPPGLGVGGPTGLPDHPVPSMPPPHWTHPPYPQHSPYGIPYHHQTSYPQINQNPYPLMPFMYPTGPQQSLTNVINSAHTSTDTSNSAETFISSDSIANTTLVTTSTSVPSDPTEPTASVNEVNMEDVVLEDTEEVLVQNDEVILADERDEDWPPIGMFKLNINDSNIRLTEL
ncbi:uncharacterized protein MELLADRAFT_84815 [Melampsora larici-populina 98AG31]|uniref:Uncharacterized protein n=1 Tax=Melampsora larici-populina (strain 98AG31 / pathotype 3-4-7) TaxID=747676 RepID=F4SCJ9_MELLP|nr:uncharacterized protein MELLADRAFT_84815 [Melampsora larici-populina 98AG31]EGF97627.1 hypothetical protein MELLADRAFT_84815 [Melampsora larici-populina 98AG31]